jgi:2'-5' RNA ligase
VTSPGPRSGLIIEVPEAEPAVRQHRERLDASAPLGIPAHITVLFSFMPPETISTAALTALEHLFAEVSRFRFRLDHTGWFGDDVLWLGPRDPGPFRALTRRVFQAFPAFPPFEGQFDDVVPHLTIGHGHPLSDLRTAKDSVQARLPIDGYTPAVTLMTQQSAGGHWIKTAIFPSHNSQNRLIRHCTPPPKIDAVTFADGLYRPCCR